MPIEAEGIRRARAAMAGADRILFVIDAVSDPHRQRLPGRARRVLPPQVPVTLVFNKIDLAPAYGTAQERPESAQESAQESDHGSPLASAVAPAIELPGTVPRPAVVVLSALTGFGMEALSVHLRQSAGLDSPADALSARGRHLDALNLVAHCLADAARLMDERGTPELVAEELRRAQLALGEIVGTESSDELLGRIFSSFCIGK